MKPKPPEIDTEVFKLRMEQLVAMKDGKARRVAYETGISISAIYNYLDGRIPDLRALFQLAQYAGKPMEWFLVPDEKILKERSEEKERKRNFSATFAFNRA